MGSAVGRWARTAGFAGVFLPGWRRASLVGRVSPRSRGPGGPFRPLVLQMVTIDGSMVTICTTFVEKRAATARERVREPPHRRQDRSRPGRGTPAFTPQGAEPPNPSSKARKHPGNQYQRLLSPGGHRPFVILRGGVAGVAEPRHRVLTQPWRLGPATARRTTAGGARVLSAARRRGLSRGR